MTYAVVGCSDCHCHWIITEEHAVRKDTRVQCPRCGTTTTGKMRVLERTDNENEACELRAQYLAKQAGQHEKYTNTTSYTEAGDTFSLDIRETTPNDTDTGTDTNDQTDKEQLVKELVEQKYNDDIRAFEYCVDVTDVARKGKFNDEAAAVVGTVGKDNQETHGDDDQHDLPDPYYPHDLGDDTPALSDVADLTVPDDVGLTPTQDQSVPGAITIDGNTTISNIWNELIEYEEIQRFFLNAVKSAAYGRYKDKFHDLLDAIGIEDTPIHGSYRGLLDLTAENDRQQWELVRATQKLGTGQRPVSGILAVATLFRFANTTPETNINTPTVTVEITHEEFKNRARNQREQICELLSILSKSLNIQLSISLMTRAFLRDQHRDDLRGVHDWSSTRSPNSRVDDALLALDANGGPAEILRALNSQPSETALYHELYATTEKARQSVRGYVSTLKDYGLIAGSGPPSEKKFTLLDAGREVLEELNNKRTRQTTLKSSVHETPKSPRHNRVTRDRKVGTDERRPPVASHSTADHPADSTADDSLYQTVWLSPAEHDAIGACSGESGHITVLERGVDMDSKTQFVSFDSGRSEAVVSTQATTPQDYIVGTAMAFSHRGLLDSALNDVTLDDILDEVPAAILRNAREIGYLTEEVLSGGSESVKEMFADWGEDIEDLERKLSNGKYGGDDDEFDNAGELCSKIVRDALGLTGSVVHLLDAAGVDVVRDVRTPSGMNSNKVSEVARTIKNSLMIQSKYGSHSAFRQLIEKRVEKRSRSFSVKVDAADPVGSMIGSMVIRGGRAESVGEAVTDEFKGIKVHEDAPSFTIPVTVEGVERKHVAVAATRVLGRKNLRPTREIVSVLNAVSGTSPFVVAESLMQLENEPKARDIDAAELRYALTKAPADSLLPDLPKSAGKIVSVLMNASEPLMKKEVADRIDMSKGTVRNQRDALESTGLIQTDGEWRVMLSFRFERGEGIVPEACSEPRDCVVTGVVYAVDTPGCKCSERVCSDVDVGVCQDPRCLLRRWLRVAVALTGSGHSRGGCQTGVVVGVECAQTPVTRFDDRDSDPDSDSGSSCGPDLDTESDSGDRRDASTETRSDGDSDRGLDFSGVEIEGAIR